MKLKIKNKIKLKMYNYKFIVDARNIGDYFKGIKFSIENVLTDIEQRYEVIEASHILNDLINYSQSICRELVIELYFKNEKVISILNHFEEDISDIFENAYFLCGNEKNKIINSCGVEILDKLGKFDYGLFITLNKMVRNNDFTITDWKPHYLITTNVWNDNNDEIIFPPEALKQVKEYYEQLVGLLLKKGLAVYSVLEILKHLNYKLVFTKLELMSVISRLNKEKYVYTNDGIFQDVQEFTIADIKSMLIDLEKEENQKGKLKITCDYFLKTLDLEKNKFDKLRQNKRYIDALLDRATYLTKEKIAQEYEIDFSCFYDIIKNNNYENFHKDERFITFLKQYNKLMRD